ncbi:MAG: amino acid permease, partial [Synechococcales cyanobacterium CRU_2_2]|nr:amino acid permease [Synechococcales cyanobacterium CRU_2_2]
AAYPREGGLQGWVRKAYGDYWAARATWCYWVNVALWMPSVYILFAGMFAQLFAPDMTLSSKIIMAVVLSWLTVLFGILSLNFSKWVPNLGAAVKAIIMLLLGCGGIYYAVKNGTANPFDLNSMTPRWDAGLAFLPVIVYNYLGFELMSGAAEEMKNPARDIPIAIVLSGLAKSVFYLIATFGILAALPQDQIGLVEGLLDTAGKIFGDSTAGQLLVKAIGVGALFTFFANMVTWSLGANRSAQAAARDGELPRVFGIQHTRFQTPAGAFVLMGLVASLVIFAYGWIARSTEELFWILFAFSSIVFLLPYLALFPTFIRLRRIDPATVRPYRVPGPRPWLLLLAFICLLFVAQGHCVLGLGAWDARGLEQSQRDHDWRVDHARVRGTAHSAAKTPRQTQRKRNAKAMSRTLSTTPRSDGFRMPGEFEPHSGTWMLWPERPDNWRWGAKPAQAANNMRKLAGDAANHPALSFQKPTFPASTQAPQRQSPFAKRNIAARCAPFEIGVQRAGRDTTLNVVGGAARKGPHSVSNLDLSARLAHRRGEGVLDQARLPDLRHELPRTRPAPVLVQQQAWLVP